jgi:hypothetical protein
MGQLFTTRLRCGNEDGIMNIEHGISNYDLYFALQNSLFVIQNSLFVFRILCLFGRDESHPYNCALSF